jgi:hypothetical protein
MARLSLTRRKSLVVVMAAALPVVLSACGSVGDKLIVAPNLEDSPEGATLWAVSPGDEPGDDNLIGSRAQDALQIFRRDAEGEVTANLLSQQWKDTLLVGTAGTEASTLNAMDPGEDPTEIATGAEAFQSLITQRGVFAFTQEGCQLAEEEAKAKPVGTGVCRLRNDNNVVAHWPAEGGDLTITDLRSDDSETVEGTFTDAQLLINDNRVLGVEQVEEGSAAKLIDGETGKVLKTFDPAEFVGVVPPARDADAFVSVSGSPTQQTMTWIEASGDSEVITSASDTFLLPVAVSAEGLHYIEARSATPDESTLFHWTAGEEPEALITGNIGAVTTGEGSVVVSDVTDDKMTFWKVESEPVDEDTEPLFEIDLDDDLQATIRNALVLDDTMHLIIGAETGTYVRLDLEGEGSAQPIEPVANLRLAAIDSTGSALFIAQDEGGSQLWISPAHHDHAEVRATAETFTGSLIHEGKVYFTAQNGDELGVWEARAQGDSVPELLYDNRILVGSTFEVFGGAIEYEVVAATDAGAGGVPEG